MIHPNRAGLVMGALLGLSHLLWASLVALGWAQVIIDFIFRLHFIQPVFVIQPFQVLTALTLIALTSLIGYGFGVCFAWLWNQLHLD